MRHCNKIIMVYYFLAGQQNVFYQLTDRTKTFHYRDTTVSRCDSPATCAMTCVSFTSNCSSFLYNVQLGQCSFGRWGWIHDSDPPRTLSSELVFWSQRCHLVDTYRLDWHQMETICLWFSDHKATYMTAKTSCEDRGLQLVTLKTTQKLIFFLGIANRTVIDRSWIGLDDQDSQYNFRWVDSSPIENDVSRQLFGPYQPDNRQKGSDYQDCVAYIPELSSFDDDFCFVMKNYICEAILP